MLKPWISPTFRWLGMLDMLLGVVLAGFHTHLLQLLGLEADSVPEFFIELIAIFIILIGLGMWFVSQAPLRNRQLMTLTMLFHFALAMVTLDHALVSHTLPAQTLWLPLALYALVLAILSLAAVLSLPRESME